MTTARQIEIANAILATGLVTKVYHSCQQLRDDQRGQLYAAYKKGNEFVYAGIDDTQGLFAYIRPNGDATGTPLRTQSCAKSYNVDAPLRVVFFSDNEDQDFEYLTEKLATFTFLTGVTLTRVITDKFRLIKEESDIFRQSFDGKTFYIAFDVFVSLVLLQSTCEKDACITYPNPLCK